MKIIKNMNKKELKEIAEAQLENYQAMAIENLEEDITQSYNRNDFTQGEINEIASIIKELIKNNG